MVLSVFILIHLQCTLYSVNIFPKSYHIILNLNSPFYLLYSFSHMSETLFLVTSNLSRYIDYLINLKNILFLKLSV